jgi:hypothetical protein
MDIAEQGLGIFGFDLCESIAKSFGLQHERIILNWLLEVDFCALHLFVPPTAAYSTNSRVELHPYLSAAPLPYNNCYARALPLAASTRARGEITADPSILACLNMMYNPDRVSDLATLRDEWLAVRKSRWFRAKHD